MNSGPIRISLAASVLLSVSNLGLGQEPLQRAQAALSVARLQLAQKESEALAGSIDRLERMLQALKGALERGKGAL